jgi:hypothetical protein
LRADAADSTSVNQIESGYKFVCQASRNATGGIPAEAFWRAWCALDRLDPAVDIDLVAVESTPERLCDEITHHGVAL